MPTRIGNALISYVAYIGKTVWPVGLVPYYPYPREVRQGHLSSFEATMAGLLLLAVTVAVLAAARRRPYLAVGWFWFLGTLAPVIGVIQVLGDYALADRFTYIPLIGLFVAVVWGVADGLALAGRTRGCRRTRPSSCLPASRSGRGSRSATGTTVQPCGGTRWRSTPAITWPATTSAITSI